MHANLFAAVVKLNNGTVPVDTSFEALYEEYRNLKGWQHEFMADHYTSLMQDALKVVHQNLDDQQFLNNYDNNTLWYWSEFYEYLSFRGLKYTEKGEKYYTDNSEKISLYENDAQNLSTKGPNCD